ncbi:PREDICTED: guanine nucleotide exchange factor for Rab-3A isoform X2 [Calidris pugnax]|uniref:guanine nucleotide exchange factor for Rab-3A isoform X2 n=1 Tax=Calidris pugnax TaxID=198806 RepID=UPI00071CD685|nr:PREDICTED: guanine nucleotide exchange factor for Rab-3A isoform X2 [Calidris pugnax]
MDTRITMSNLPACGVVSGGEAEDGAAETREGAAAVCEGLEGMPPPGGKPKAMASQANFEEESQKQPAVGHWKTLMPSKGSKEEPETACQDAEGVDETQSTEQLNVSRLRSSSVEIREKGSEFLKEELHKAQKELKLKDKECERLSKVREQLEQELEELTASLFEEAHKMVREANTKQAASEKQLREARGKIDMLQAEVTALKTLVITSTPSSPNRELHPQLQSPSKAVFRKGHGRNKSTSSAMVSAASQNVTPEPVSHERKEVDSILFAEFQAWKESPTLDKSCSFLDRIYREDVGPCLDFTKQELSELVRVAVEQNTLTIEPIASQALPVVKVSTEECGGPNGFRSQIVTFGPQPACLHPIGKADTSEQDSFRKSLAWNMEEMCRDQMMLVTLCSSLTSLIFSVVWTWAVCQEKGNVLSVASPGPASTASCWGILGITTTFHHPAGPGSQLCATFSHTSVTSSRAW